MCSLISWCAYMVVINNLTKSFGTIRAVKSVSMQITRGDIFGLVGPDGAGKTTLIRMICKLLAPDSGTVTITDNQVFSYMPQKFSLYGDLTVMENINFFGALYNLDRATIQQRADEILALTDLIKFKNRFADHLSGGMKQKLALTCALISRPNVLLLDEPTFGVDPQSRKDFWKILYQLNKESITIIVSTPYMDEAELCKTVGFLDHGKLIAVDTPPNLKNNCPYQVWEVHCSNREPDLFNTLPGIKDASFYGHKYRLLVEHTLNGQLITEFLLQKNIPHYNIHPVAATMEDVFISLATNEVV